MWVSEDVSADVAMDSDIKVVDSVDGGEVAGEVAAGSSDGDGSSSEKWSYDLTGTTAG